MEDKKLEQLLAHNGIDVLNARPIGLAEAGRILRDRMHDERDPLGVIFFDGQVTINVDSLLCSFGFWPNLLVSRARDGVDFGPVTINPGDYRIRRSEYTIPDNYRVKIGRNVAEVRNLRVNETLEIRVSRGLLKPSNATIEVNALEHTGVWYMLRSKSAVPFFDYLADQFDLRLKERKTVNNVWYEAVDQASGVNLSFSRLGWINYGITARFPKRRDYEDLRMMIDGLDIDPLKIDARRVPYDSETRDYVLSTGGEKFSVFIYMDNVTGTLDFLSRVLGRPYNAEDTQKK